MNLDDFKEECPHLTRIPPKSREEMTEAMKGCEQTSGFSVYDHGEAVYANLTALIDHMKGLSTLPEGLWRLPEWVGTYKAELLANLHHEGRRQFYTVFHDCGKPYCRFVDENGQQHFPNHAEVSSYIWACVGGNNVVGHLIHEDMVIHTATADEIAAKMDSSWSCEDSVTLLLVALCEIHANARMFGGLGSTSFKVKWKAVDRRGKQICKKLFPAVSKEAKVTVP